MMKRRDIAGTRLGGLEAELMDLLWAAGEPLGVRELAGLLPGPPRASTTIVTVLTHLMAKGLVERAGDGRRYTYRPAYDPGQLTSRAFERWLASVTDGLCVQAHQMNGTQDPGLLAELAALLRDSQPDSEEEGRP